MRAQNRHAAVAVPTSADIYQLGVLLYELLTGRSPYQQHNSTSMHTLRAICELEPLRPSAAVMHQGEQASAIESLAAARAMTAQRPHRRLRGDLDNIILKALQKEPERRYGSVRELREDILRLLEGRPVQEHRATWGYRAEKFVRRHAAILSMASAVTVAFSATVGWYTIRLAHERDRAEITAQKAHREARGAAQVSDLLVSLLHASDPHSAAPDITARQLLERGAARVEVELADEPRVQARMMSVIGRVYVDLELDEKAQPLLERALQPSRELFCEHSPEVADSMQALARLAQGRGEFLHAQRLYRQTLAIRERVAGGHEVAMADTLTGLAIVMIHLGEGERAIPVLSRAQQIYTGTVHTATEQELKVDGQPVTRLTDLAGVLACVSFGPEDAELARGAPQLRRRYIDYTLAETSRTSLKALSEYRRVLQQRGALLRAARRGEPDIEPALRIWDEKLVHSDCEVVRRRAEALQDLAPRAAGCHARLGGGETLRLRYTVHAAGRRVLAGDELQRCLEAGDALEAAFAGRLRERRE